MARPDGRQGLKGREISAQGVAASAAEPCASQQKNGLALKGRHTNFALCIGEWKADI